MSFPELIEELDRAVTHGTPEQRSQILHRITDVYVAGSESYSVNQVELFDDVFVRVAAMIELSARTALANRLAKVRRAPSMISRILASDDAIDVARPVLEQSPLDNETLVATARTKSQQHLLAISRRNSLDEAVTDVLVERGDKPVVLSTATNPAARFSDNGYKTLVRRSDGDDELTTCVALRPDIPRQHLVRLLVRASHAVQLKLEAANPSMAITIQSAVAEAATMILEKTKTLSRDYAAARTHIESLHSAGRLGESDVAGFATANQSRRRRSRSRFFAVCQSRKSTGRWFKTRQKRSWSWLRRAECPGQRPRLCCGCARARAVFRPGELEQCLGIFNRLKTATAQQVIAFQGKRSRFTRSGRSAA